MFVADLVDGFGIQIYGSYDSGEWESQVVHNSSASMRCYSKFLSSNSSLAKSQTATIGSSRMTPVRSLVLSMVT